MNNDSNLIFEAYKESVNDTGLNQELNPNGFLETTMLGLESLKKETEHFMDPVSVELLHKEMNHPEAHKKLHDVLETVKELYSELKKLQEHGNFYKKNIEDNK